MNKYRSLILAAAAVFVIVPVLAGSALAQPNCSAGQVLTAKSCAGDAASANENALFQLVNKYRTANGRAALRLSAPLSLLANRRVLDLQLNMRTLTHSWSNCPYDINVQKTWPCVTDAPRRLNTGYNGEGYETLYRTTAGQAEPALALQAWQKSSLHNSIILNEGTFKDTKWDEVGVAIDGQYAVLWFGSPATKQKGFGAEKGLGVSFDEAVAGLTKIFAITQTSAQVESGKWQGTSADKKIKLEIYGARSDISEANVAISLKLDAGKLSPQAQAAVSTLLKNLFPEWQDSDRWLLAAVEAISQNQSVTKTKLVRKNAIEIASNAPNSLKLLIRPEGKLKYVEVF